jgi:hypothetical protein
VLGSINALCESKCKWRYPPGVVTRRGTPRIFHDGAAIMLGNCLRIRMLALRSVKDESITCYKNEIRIGVLDDDRSRAVGSWLRDSFPIR